VYEQGLKGNHLGLRCGGCRKPINNPRNRLRCENCMRRAAPCPICWCVESPFESSSIKKRKGSQSQHHEESKSKIDASKPDDGEGYWEEEDKRRPQLYSTCLNCNHSAHAACLSIWHGDTTSRETVAADTDNGCPTPGCLCTCIAARAVPVDMVINNNKRRVSGDALARRREVAVKEDEWKVSESSAVGTVRRSLGRGETK